MRVRATGFALPYSISVAVFGGTAPYLQAYLASQGQSTLFSLYVIVTLAILFVTVLVTKETKGVDLS